VKHTNEDLGQNYGQITALVSPRIRSLINYFMMLLKPSNVNRKVFEGENCWQSIAYLKLFESNGQYSKSLDCYRWTILEETKKTIGKHQGYFFR
jgi:hypothetical protein